jgi:hypothetical protein
MVAAIAAAASRQGPIGVLSQEWRSHRKADQQQREGGNRRFHTV